jgi:hypothetical protein
MLTAFGCHPMQSSMDDWSSLEEDESLSLTTMGFLVSFLMLRRRVPGKTTLPMLRLKYSRAKKSSCLCLRMA